MKVTLHNHGASQGWTQRLAPLGSPRLTPLRSPVVRRDVARLVAVAILFAGLAGCQSITNPVADGIPVYRLPNEALAKSKKRFEQVPLGLLRQKPPDMYRLDTGDVLGIWIDNVLGQTGVPIVVTPAEPNLPPALGYPVLVQVDGTISLPYVKPLLVRNLSLPEVEKLIRDSYQGQEPGKRILLADARVLVTLQRRRRYNILVVRQETSAPTVPVGGIGGIGATAQPTGTTGTGSGTALELPAGENDVMNALARSGGLPGFGGSDEVVIERGAYVHETTTGARPSASSCAPGAPGASGDDASTFARLGARNTRIPLRIEKGQPLPFKPEDVVLYNNDVLYIRPRDAEVFYVGGLAFTGQYLLPRDYDLGVVEALATVRAPLVSGGVLNSNSFSGAAAGGGSGIGSPNPSLVSVVRRLADGRQFVIAVDLNKALREPREDIIVQKNDILILQFSPGEALVRYFSQQLHFNFLATLVRQTDLNATSTLDFP